MTWRRGIPLVVWLSIAMSVRVVERSWGPTPSATGSAVPAVIYAAGNGSTPLADSVLDWELSRLDGSVAQGEFGWEYGYISNYAGAGGVFYGWHLNPFYWQQPTDITIYWPKGYPPPDEAWGIGGDSTGCRPPMSWKDGAYPWAQAENDQWAAARRWQSTHTGFVSIEGAVGRYFDSLLGWDVVFAVALNADDLADPVLYSLEIPWNDHTRHEYSVSGVPVTEGDYIVMYVNAAGASAANSYMHVSATISAVPAVFVPDLVGRPIGDVEQMLRDASLHLGTVSYAFAADPVDQVIGQDPPGGMEAGAGSAVNVQVSLGSELQAADADGDWAVNLQDVAVLAAAWVESCGPTAWCGGADVNRDGVVDLKDLQIVAGQWARRIVP